MGRGPEQRGSSALASPPCQSIAGQTPETLRLETVTEGQLPADARAFCTVASNSTALGFDDECVMLGRDTQTGLDEVGAVVGRLLVHGLTVEPTGTLGLGIAEHALVGEGEGWHDNPGTRLPPVQGRSKLAKALGDI